MESFKDHGNGVFSLSQVEYDADLCLANFETIADLLSEFKEQNPNYKITLGLKIGRGIIINCEEK